MLDTETNLKHRLLLAFVYSAGLRVSEVVCLKWRHIDFSRNTLLIQGGKGRKDRYTLLSDAAAKALQEYSVPHEADDRLFPGEKFSKSKAP